MNLSPFSHATKIKEPLLLIHGAADNNSGTHTMQSERFYEAVKGGGGTVRLVLLPHESHGYLARESILHALAEMLEWADKHVKNRKPEDQARRASACAVPVAPAATAAVVWPATFGRSPATSELRRPTGKRAPLLGCL